MRGGVRRGVDYTSIFDCFNGLNERMYWVKRVFTLPCQSLSNVFIWGVGQGKALGGWHLPNLEFEKGDAICCRPTKYLNFSLAPSALAIDILYSLKRREKHKHFRLRLGRAEKQ